MPQNMQKKPRVVELDLDAQLEQTLREESYERLRVEDVATLPDDDPRYLTALRLLQHGNSPKKIAAKLVKDGIMDYRADAMQLAERVLKENPQEQVMNAYILFGVAGFFIIGGFLFILPGLISTGTLPLVQPAYLLFLVAAWFVFKGYQAWQKAR